MSYPLLVVPPAAEPISLETFKGFLEWDTDDDSRDVKLYGLLAAAREDCEKWTRRAFITQTWLQRLDGFAGFGFAYDRNGYPEIRLPLPPFQSIESFKYVDTAGVLQDLQLDVTYGSGPNVGVYGYQLERGSLSQPARLTSAWAKPWPPTRMVPANVLIQFRCGYGGPITVSIAQGSKQLVANGFKFNAGDVPLIAGDTPFTICIPGANPGAANGALTTTVASVDVDGAATLADAAAATVNGARAWFGGQVPQPLCQAIMFLAQFYLEQGAVTGQDIPEVVKSLRAPYRNLVS